MLRENFECFSYRKKKNQNESGKNVKVIIKNYLNDLMQKKMKRQNMVKYDVKTLRKSRNKHTYH